MYNYYTNKNKKGGYRIWILIGCLFLEALSLGAINNSFALYTIPVTEGLNISRPMFSMGQTLIFLATMLMNTLVGTVISRIGILRTMKIGSLLISAAYFSYALVGGIVPFLGASIVIGLMMPMVTAVPISLLIRGWFTENVGLALGIAFMGSGIGGMIFNPFGSWLIRHFGWRYAYGTIGILMFVILNTVTWFILREPEGQDQHGETGKTGIPGSEKTKADVEEPKTAKMDTIGAGMPQADTAESLSIREEFREKLFWIIMLLAFCMGAGTYTIINFTSTYLQDTGHSAAYAANIASITMGAMAIGKLVVGRMYDRLGVKRSTLICVMALLLGMVGFSYIRLPGAIAAVILGAAIGCPVGTVASPIIARFVFGERDFAQKVGMSTAFGNLGAAVTPVLSGWLYAAQGSYRMMYQMMVVLMAFAFVVYWRVLGVKKRTNMGESQQ